MIATKILKTFACAAIFVLTSMQASAGVIVASGDTNLTGVNQFYSNMFNGSDVFATNGWSVDNTSSAMFAASNSFTFGVLSVEALNGMEWFVASTNNTYSASELDIIKNFVAGGGNLFVLGEEATGYGDMDVVANAVLQAVGSTMTIGAPQGSAMNWTSSGSNIGINPLTAGVTTLGGNYAGTVTGGSALFASDADGSVIVAAENLPGNQVPEPATLALFCLGLFGVCAARRYKK